MAKNTEDYISDAISALINNNKCKLWELIIVDDHSTDKTSEIVSSFAEQDDRIKVFRNPSTGKVSGTNYAFIKSTGAVVKCIDSDDVLLPLFFDILHKHNEHDVIAHGCVVTNDRLQSLTSYHPNVAWLTSDVRSVLQNVVSLPKFSWSFSRRVAHRVFPMPDDLPFEDAWMSIILKRYAVNPLLSKQRVYLYRQHTEQTFSGILNYSKEAVQFRAKRLLSLVSILEKNPTIRHLVQDPDFGQYCESQKYLSGDMSFWSFLMGLRISNFRTVLRSIILRELPVAAPTIVRIKWAFDAYRANKNQ